MTFEVDSLGLPEDPQDPPLNIVGAETSSDPSILASIPFDVFRDAVTEELVLNDGETPTLFQKGRFFKFFKDLMRSFPTEAPGPSSTPSTSTAPVQPIVVHVADKPRGLPLRDWIDQTAGAETFEVLPEADIAKLRQNYFTRTGSQPDPTETPSDEQLSAMAHWLRPAEGARVRPPFAEFAVFVPYASRAAKMRTFSAMVLDRDGSWAQRSLRGPANFGQWEASWNVYAVTLVMLDVASPGALKTYFQAFRRLC